MSIVDVYAKYFDTCAPIDYHGLELRPFTVREIRESQYACHCLSIDPIEFDDITLMPLKRLDLILTLQERLEQGCLPSNTEAAGLYQSVVQSFQFLMQSRFPDYLVYPGDPLHPQRKRALTFIQKCALEALRQDGGEAFDCITLSPAEFEDMAELILYQNAVDTSYKQIPPAMRREAEKVRALLGKRKNKQKFDLEKAIDVAFYHLKDYGQVLDLPVRKFFNLLYNIQGCQDYEILMSGMYQVKDVSHWMYGSYNRNPYEGVFEREEELNHKLKDF